MVFSPKDTLSEYERYYGMILNMKRNHLSHGPQPRYLSLSMNRINEIKAVEFVKHSILIIIGLFPRITFSDVLSGKGTQG